MLDPRIRQTLDVDLMSACSLTPCLVMVYTPTAVLTSRAWPFTWFLPLHRVRRGTYSTQFRVPDVYGVYKLVLRYHAPGYNPLFVSHKVCPTHPSNGCIISIPPPSLRAALCASLPPQPVRALHSPGLPLLCGLLRLAGRSLRLHMCLPLRQARAKAGLSNVTQPSDLFSRPISTLPHHAHSGLCQLPALLTGISAMRLA